MQQHSPVLFEAIFGASGAVIGVQWFVQGFRELKTKRVVQNTPTAKIRSAAIGAVELVGSAVGPYVLKAPITGEACFYYRTLIQKQGGPEQWHTVVDRKRQVPFFLEDETGRIMVDMDGAEIDLVAKYDVERSFQDDIGAAAAQFAGGQYGGSLAGARHTVRYQEFIIAPGQQLYVLGTVMENDSRELKPVIDFPVLPGIEPDDSPPILDKPLPRPEDFDQKPAAVLGRGEHGSRFYVSGFTQDEILADVQWDSFAKLWGGPLLTIASTTFLMWRFGLVRI